jgi:hypothetical protein
MNRGTKFNKKLLHNKMVWHQIKKTLSLCSPLNVRAQVTCNNSEASQQNKRWWVLRFREKTVKRFATHQLEGLLKTTQQQDSTDTGASIRDSKVLYCTDWLVKLAQAVMFLTCVQEAPNLNLDCDTSYPDWGYSWFFSIPPGNTQYLKGWLHCDGWKLQVYTWGDTHRYV